MRIIDADEFESYLINRYGGNDCADDIIDDLHNQPTVEAVERKRGEWKWNNADGLYYSCSCCGHKAYGNTIEIIDGAYHFCPSCGADMREGEEECLETK